MRLRDAQAFFILAVGLSLPSGLTAQDNTFDLRLVELDHHGDRTYQNFIYTRAFAHGRLMLEAYHLVVPRFDYRETSIGGGVRLFGKGASGVYLLGHVATGSDEDYVQPALFAIGSSGKWNGAFYLMNYIPLGDAGVNQVLIDPIEVTYRVFGPLLVGGSFYYWRPTGGPSITKTGAQAGLALGHFTPLFAVRNVNQGRGVEFLTRLLVVF